MAFARQVGLLLWKNFVLQVRNKCVLVFEFVIPLFFAVIVLLMRLSIQQEVHTEKTEYLIYTMSYYFGYDPVILFSPNNSLITEVMENVRTLSKVKSVSVITRGFINSSELESFYKLMVDTTPIFMAVEFDVSYGTTILPSNLHVFFRPRAKNKYNLWKTEKTFEFNTQNLPRSSAYPDYFGSGFYFMQYMVSQAVIQQWDSTAEKFFNNFNVQLQRIPYPPYIEDPLVTIIQKSFSMFILMSFIFTSMQITKNIVYEKERKLKESMKLMGLSAAANWVSWFITILTFHLIISAVYIIFFCASISKYGPVLTKTDPSVFVVFLLCYGMSFISFCFMLSTFFQKANVATNVSGIFFFVAYLPWIYLQTTYQDMSRPAKLGSNLLFNTAMAFGVFTIGLHEGTGAGAQWSNIAEPASVDDNYSLLDSMLFLLLDSAIHFLITWYVDNINPGEFGVPRPLYFPFTSSYWCSTQVTKCQLKEESTTDTIHFETEPTGLTAGIRIRNLTKVFGSGEKKNTAVNNLKLNFFDGQISVLLGHNGAGKTTTMSMLTGFIPPTTGTAKLNDYDIRTDINHVRRSLGLCPQHNILFDTLTVLEHLKFFASLKNVPRDKVTEAAYAMVREVGLEQKTETQTKTLSGGQKRKLSVGIALIGGSKIVILDEPTSGMDPAARRQTWDILQRNKMGRTLVLTTHFMDEADLLGDRIAIMAEGVVKCCGSSMFLKKLYGTGYHLVIVKNETCVVNTLTAVIQKIIPTTHLESEINTELTYLLPDNQSHMFPQLFNELDTNKEILGIFSFGTTATTMEEVFLKVGKDAEHYDKNEEQNRVTTPSSTFYKSAWDSDDITPDTTAFNNFNRERGFALQVHRFKALLIKKALHTWRNRIMTLAQILLPVIFTIFALASGKSAPTEFSEVSLKLDLTPFGGSVVPYTDGLAPSSTTTFLAQHYRGLFSNNNVPERIDRTVYQNMTEYFMKKITSMGIATFNKRVVIAGEFESHSSSINGLAFFNGQPLHSMPISLSFLMNSIASFLIKGTKHSITVYNYPLPQNTTDIAANSSKYTIAVGFMISFNLMFGMGFLTSSFVFFLIKERVVGAKHLQTVSGVGPMIFWLSNLTWDYINYLIPCLLLLPVFAAFQIEAYVLDGRLGIVFLNLLLHGWAVLPFVYILQYMFKSPATGLGIVTTINIMIGMTSILLVMIMQIPKLHTKDIGDILEWVFIILLPHFCLSKSLMDMYTNYVNINICNELNYKVLCYERHVAMPCCKGNCGGHLCLPFSENYLVWEAPGIGRHVMFMFLQGLLYFDLILFIENNIPQRIWYALYGNQSSSGYQSNIIDISGNPPHQEDSDVIEEKKRINNNNIDKLAETDSLILSQLYKRFGTLVAVDNISVGIPEKECFGLLGQNGAGKTTTFKMLTGEIMVTNGNAYVKKYNIKNSLLKVHENMGYCPQFDALLDQMTGRETLYMYSRLKGVPENRIKDTVNSLIDMMLLVPHADKLTSQYSGGNKRKLSTAISLVGNPSFILLDEPSTGMDPKARRQLWNLLSRVRAFGKILVLTSHSMEECDALCTRLAIMVNGHFRCLGSPQHLKNKFGQGYTLIAHMATLSDHIIAPTQPMIDFIHYHFPYAIVFDDHQGYVHFQVPDANVSIAQVFTVMEQAKRELNVENYSVHQTTLEQVFLSFTREQTAPKEDKTNFINNFCC